MAILRVVRRVLTYVFLLLVAMVSLLPLYWVFSTALKEPRVIIVLPPEWIPWPPTFENFRMLLAGNPFGRWFLNSVIVSSGITVSVLFTSALAGYAFAKKEFVGKEFLFWIIIGSMMIPRHVTIVPLYLLAFKLKLINTYTGLIAPGLMSAFGVFLMRQFIRTIPSALIDAARMDSCTELGVFLKVIVPLSKPALAVLAIFTFMGTWNEFLWPLLVAQDKMMYTLQVALPTITSGEYMTYYGKLMAGTALAAMPMVVVFFSLQKYFVRGLRIGALRG